MTYSNPPPSIIDKCLTEGCNLVIWLPSLYFWLLAPALIVQALRARRKLAGTTGPALEQTPLLLVKQVSGL